MHVNAADSLHAYHTRQDSAYLANACMLLLLLLL
jgi:hypothetical protein